MSPEWVFFLDENHHRTPAVLRIFAELQIRVERHGDHFQRGTPDEVWLPKVGQNGWVLLTSDTRIRHHYSELAQVIENEVRLFCFSSNNQTAEALAQTLRTAMPEMLLLLERAEPPFFATIDKNGKITLRNYSLSHSLRTPNPSTPR